jgi:uncharacterized protein YndB with AHSA1/START domain
MSPTAASRSLIKEITVPAPRSAVWEAWTTAAGTRTFFAPEARIELRLGGPYEILFDLDAPAGSQGSEGATVLSFLPEEMFSFSWNNPPVLAEIRNEKTYVVIQFSALSPVETHVKLSQLGWLEGALWDQSYAYFDRAWGVVMSRLRERFITGPINWSQIG